MKERVLDVLMYLFDHCLSESDEVESTDQKHLSEELESAGFHAQDINKAFDWLDGIHTLENTNEGIVNFGNSLSNSFRIYTKRELKRFNLECRSFLLYLEQIGVVDTISREVIIDRVLALDMDEIKLEHLKWVTLMVLINRGTENSLEWLEEIVFNDYQDVLQ